MPSVSRGTRTGTLDVVECRCTTVTELYGSEAEEYAAQHLRSDGTRADRLEEDFLCPDTGRRWLLDYPDQTTEDPGQARLRADL